MDNYLELNQYYSEIRDKVKEDSLKRRILCDHTYKLYGISSYDLKLFLDSGYTLTHPELKELKYKEISLDKTDGNLIYFGGSKEKWTKFYNKITQHKNIKKFKDGWIIV